MRFLIPAVLFLAVAVLLTSVQPRGVPAQGLREATLSVTGMT